ncbi:hypothetical protein ACXYRO_00260 [Mycoplasma sp. 4013]
MKKKLKSLLILSSLTTSTIAVSCGTTTFANTNRSGGSDSVTSDKNKKHEPSPQELRDKAIELFVKENKINDNYYKYNGRKDNNPFLKDWDYWFKIPGYSIKNYDADDVRNWRLHITRPYMNIGDFGKINDAFDAKINGGVDQSLWKAKKQKFNDWAKAEFGFIKPNPDVDIEVSMKNYNGDLYQLINDVVNDKINIDEQTKENFYNEVLAYLKHNENNVINGYDNIYFDKNKLNKLTDNDLNTLANESKNQYQNKYLRYFASVPNDESGVKIADTVLNDVKKMLSFLPTNFVNQIEGKRESNPADPSLANLMANNYYAQMIRTWYSYKFTDYKESRNFNQNISYSPILTTDSLYTYKGFVQHPIENYNYNINYIDNAYATRKYSNEQKQQLKKWAVNPKESDAFKYSFLPWTFNLNGVYDPKVNLTSYDLALKAHNDPLLNDLKDPNEKQKQQQDANTISYAPISMFDAITDSGGKFMAVDENQRKYYISLIEYKQVLKKLNDALKLMDYKKNGDQQASKIEKIEELNKNNDARYVEQKKIFNDFKIKLNTYTAALIAILDINNFLGIESVFPQTKDLKQILVDMLPYGKNSNFEFSYKDANEKLNNEVLGWYTVLSNGEAKDTLLDGFLLGYDVDANIAFNVASYNYLFTYLNTIYAKNNLEKINRINYSEYKKELAKNNKVKAKEIIKKVLV